MYIYMYSYIAGSHATLGSVKCCWVDFPRGLWPTSFRATMARAPTPVQRSSKEETFGALAQDFGLSSNIEKLLKDWPGQTLEDFRFYFTTEEEIAVFCATDTELKGTDLKLQVSRVRQAWTAVRAMGRTKDEAKSQADIADLDDLIGEAALREVKTNFWQRYRMRYPSEIMPSDALVSRCYREQSRRLLMVFDLWNTKTLMYQVTSTRKRKKVGTDLYIYIFIYTRRRRR